MKNFIVLILTGLLVFSSSSVVFSKTYEIKKCKYEVKYFSLEEIQASLNFDIEKYRQGEINSNFILTYNRLTLTKKIVNNRTLNHIEAIKSNRQVVCARDKLSYRCTENNNIESEKIVDNTIASIRDKLSCNKKVTI